MGHPTVSVFLWHSLQIVRAPWKCWWAVTFTASKCDTVRLAKASCNQLSIKASFDQGKLYDCKSKKWNELTRTATKFIVKKGMPLKTAENDGFDTCWESLIWGMSYLVVIIFCEPVFPHYMYMYMLSQLRRLRKSLLMQPNMLLHVQSWGRAGYGGQSTSLVESSQDLVPTLVSTKQEILTCSSY